VPPQSAARRRADPPSAFRSTLAGWVRRRTLVYRRAVRTALRQCLRIARLVAGDGSRSRPRPHQERARNTRDQGPWRSPHSRRKFYEFFEATTTPAAAEVLRRISELYAIDERVRGQSSAMRRAEQWTFSKPLLKS
jgi:hypothetical protein